MMRNPMKEIIVITDDVINHRYSRKQLKTAKKIYLSPQYDWDQIFNELRRQECNEEILPSIITIAICEGSIKGPIYRECYKIRCLKPDYEKKAFWERRYSLDRPILYSTIGGPGLGKIVNFGKEHVKWNV